MYGTHPNNIDTDDDGVTDFEEVQAGVASADKVAICDESGAGTIIGIWGGARGRYDIALNYVDESDGQGIFVLFVNNRQVDTITGDLNDDQYHLTPFRGPVSLKPGDEIRLEMLTHRKMGNRADYLEITKAK